MMSRRRRKFFAFFAIVVVVIGMTACSRQTANIRNAGNRKAEAEENGQDDTEDLLENQPVNTIPPLDTEPPKAKIVSGKCGKDAVWSYNRHTKRLRITGSGVVDQGIKKRYRVKEIQIGEGITALDGGALFLNVMKADTAREIKLSLPDSLVRIGTDTFDPRFDVGWIRHIHIPRRVRYIEEGALWGLGAEYDAQKSGKKMKITIDSRNPYYTVKEGVLFTKDEKTLVCYPAEKPDKIYRIPKKVTRIMPLAFARNASLTKVILPENIEEIGAGAFFRAFKLSKINLEQARKIKWLRDFDGIKNRVYTDSCLLSHDGEYSDDPDEYWNYSDDYRKDPYDKEISGRIDTYYLGTFAGTNLKSIQFPDSLKYASYNTFRNCISLRKISLGRSYAGEINPDERCDPKGLALYQLKLKDICVSPQNTHYRVRDHILYSRDGRTLYQPLSTYHESELVVDRRVKKIARGAFLKAGRWMNAPNLRKVVVLGGLKEILCSTFAGSGIRSFEVHGDVDSIGDGAFRYCKELKRFICHGSVKRIGIEAFCDDWRLWKFSFENELEYIGKYAFDGCENLKAPRIKKG